MLKVDKSNSGINISCKTKDKTDKNKLNILNNIGFKNAEQRESRVGKIELANSSISVKQYIPIFIDRNLKEIYRGAESIPPYLSQPARARTKTGDVIEAPVSDFLVEKVTGQPFEQIAMMSESEKASCLRQTANDKPQQDKLACIVAGTGNGHKQNLYLNALSNVRPDRPLPTMLDKKVNDGSQDVDLVSVLVKESGADPEQIALPENYSGNADSYRNLAALKQRLTEGEFSDRINLKYRLLDKIMDCAES